MKAYLSNLDERFLSLLRKNALDPLETLLNLKHILQINTNTPSNLVESDIAHHFISKEICHLFGVEAINMYILQSEDLMIKYSSNAEPRPYIVGPDSATSIAQTVLKVLVPVTTFTTFNNFTPLVPPCIILYLIHRIYYYYHYYYYYYSTYLNNLYIYL